MLRDNLVGLIEPMLSSAGANPLALHGMEISDDRPPCLENPRPEGAESTLTENAASPFQAEPRHGQSILNYFRNWFGATFGEKKKDGNCSPPVEARDSRFAISRPKRS